MPQFRPKVNYSLRPAKATVRRMVVDALARLGPLNPVNEYRYVGMGSTYFRDFQIIHRRLGISDMTTIEGEAQAEDRVRFNLPLACIEVVMKKTSDALPEIRLEDVPHIVWLDYESRVDEGVLSDVEEMVGRCAASSVLIVTVNAERLQEDQRDSWLNELGSNRPEPSYPRRRSEYALLSYRVLREHFRAALESRNAARSKGQRVNFHQIFHMVYADGNQMLTIGGALVAEEDLSKWDECQIESLEFVRSNEDPCKIKIPFLTRREAQYLLSAMPDESGELKDVASKVGISDQEAKEFAAVYRYAPQFVEAEDW